MDIHHEDEFHKQFYATNFIGNQSRDISQIRAQIKSRIYVGQKNERDQLFLSKRLKVETYDKALQALSDATDAEKVDSFLLPSF